MASRYPTRAEYLAMSAEELEELDDGRKELKLTRKPKARQITRRKRRVDIGAMLTQTQWAELRELVFRRAGWACERCGVTPPRRHNRLQAHHRKLVAQGGPDAAVNLAALCVECHEWCHRNVLKAQASGFIVPSWADPAVRVMRLHDGALVLLGDGPEYAWSSAA